MYILARINKETLKYIREKKSISYDYILRITKFPKDKISLWEDPTSSKFPTINQAKAIAKCYHVPFAGFYMNSSDINLKHLPQFRNLRTLSEPVIDDSALNLAVLDVLDAKELLLDSLQGLNSPLPYFNLTISIPETTTELARILRTKLKLDTNIQYRCQSTRQFYLYLRELVENTGIFVHCFTGVEPEIVRGFAIYDNQIPVIGLNNNDRYPAKTFTIIHELVHILRRHSTICNEISDSFSLNSEEMFCNAVAGEFLVPKDNLFKQLGSYTSDEINLDIIDTLSKKFSVSKEVICRRLLDTEKIPHSKYVEFTRIIAINFDNERKLAKENRKITGKGIPRNISRESIDKNSTILCKTFYNGFREGYFDKQDIARYLGIKLSHINKFILEVSKW